MDNGQALCMVIGIDSESSEPTIRMVQDTTGRKNPPYGWGLLGGVIENGETPDEAMVREGLEEDGDKKIFNLSMITKSFYSKTIGRTQEGEEYNVFIYVTEDPGGDLRTEGTSETGPPTRQLLAKLAKKEENGRLPVYRSHLEIIFWVVYEKALKDATMAHIARQVGDYLGIWK